VQAITGYRHLNNRHLSVFNEFSKQLKGEVKRYVTSKVSTLHCHGDHKKFNLAGI
jgi:hypothetical protein